MWTIAESLFFLLIALLAVTEFFIPLLLNKPFFGSFKKHKPAPAPEPKTTPNPADLRAKVKEAMIKVKEVKDVQDEVTEFHKGATDLKDEADNLTK